MRAFLGTVGFCRLWIPGFVEMVTPLYPLTKQLLPLALYRARNTPGPHGLTPFEIIYGSPPPAISFFDSDISALTASPTLQAHLQALQLVQQEIWKPISAAYRADNPVPCPHPFKIGDTVLVRRHQTKTLEPRWKGPSS